MEEMDVHFSPDINTVQIDASAEAMKVLLRDVFVSTRKELNVIEAQFAIDNNLPKPSDEEIKNSRSMSGMLALLIFMCYRCSDPAAMLAECRQILDKYIGIEPAAEADETAETLEETETPAEA